MNLERPQASGRKIAIIGTGYVGLTTAASFAYLGNQVTCVDVDERKVELLTNGVAPFYEPGLVEILEAAKSNLSFTTEYAKAVADAEVIFIAVGTPSGPTGAPDLSGVFSTARQIGIYLTDGHKIIVNKSTVPVGSSVAVSEEIERARRLANCKGTFEVASNPEFLRQGSALADTLYPDRVVVGGSQSATAVLENLYAPILEQSFNAPEFLPRPQKPLPKLVSTNAKSAELIKYAANAFLATKISFVNEMAELADAVGADITDIAYGVGLDSRIGPEFLKAGIGWGGSCFGKDTLALVEYGSRLGISMDVTSAVRAVNYRQRERFIAKLQDEVGDLKGKKIALLGLSFKPDTDDLRDSPAIEIAKALLGLGCALTAHDPIAGEKFASAVPDVAVTKTVMEAIKGVDAALLLTEWPCYRELDFKSVAGAMKNAVLLDGRNFIDPQSAADAGMRYVGMGRSAEATVYQNRGIGAL